jgi:hypothetical protein
MAQLVKLEPGDILALSNVGEEQAEILRESWSSVREAIGVEYVFVFERDVDLSRLPSGWTPPPEVVSGDGGE